VASRTRRVAYAASLLVVLTACSATTSNTHSGSGAPSSHPVSMSPGMGMSPGMKMSPGMNMRDAARQAGPSRAARMICGREIRGDISRKLAVGTVAPGTVTWDNMVYSCSYQLGEGPLVLSVQDSPNDAIGRAYFRSTRQNAEKAQPLHGLLSLGLPSYETPDGSVVFLKDGKTLTVDASKLQDSIGPSHLSRSALAYAVAADVVACWSE
jgi:hypothetical protein